MNIFLASMSEHKVSACRAAFEKVVGDVTICTVKTSSGVSSQPLGKEETRKGCLARLGNVRDAHPNQWIVSIENGLFRDGQTYYDQACVAIQAPSGSMVTHWSRVVVFPEKQSHEAYEKGGEITAGELLVRDGIISDPTDPHQDLIGISRAKILEETLIKILQQI